VASLPPLVGLKVGGSATAAALHASYRSAMWVVAVLLALAAVTAWTQLSPGAARSQETE
jgi:hypothetical protein